MSAAKTADCPSDELVAAFARGNLEPTAADTFAAHLETCADCRSAAESVNADSFIMRLRAAYDQPPMVDSNSSVHGDSVSRTNSATVVFEPSSVGGSPAKSDALRVPEELIDHPEYQLVKQLGRGGMGVVFLARNRAMDRLEVLKVVNKSLLEQPGARDRFQREIRAAAKLSHPNIVAAYSVPRGVELIFAMEYVAGQDLSQLVKQRGPLSVIQATYYIFQAALGLQHAYEHGMAHRDIKPNNLILAVQGKRHLVKILDFGLAKATNENATDSELTGSGRMLGTPDYVAPEQTLDAQKVDIRADIYSLGCTFYYLLTGKPPFAGASLYAILAAHHSEQARPLTEVRSDVPAELTAVVAKMMAKQPADRYQTPAELARELKPFFRTDSPRSLNGGGADSPLPASANNTTAGPKADMGDVAETPRENAGNRDRQPRTSKPSLSQLPSSSPASTTPPTAAPSAAQLFPQELAVRQQAAANIPAGGEETAMDAEFNASFGKVGRRIRTRTPAVQPRSKGRNRRLPPVLYTAGICGFGAALVLGALIFRIPTSEGMLTIEVNEPTPEITIDGKKTTVRWETDGRKAEISLAVGQRRVQVMKDGFTAVGEEVTIHQGSRQLLTARLEPISDPSTETPTRIEKNDESTEIASQPEDAEPLAQDAPAFLATRSDVPPLDSEAIGKALLAPIKKSWRDAKLIDVAQDLRAAYGVNVVIDEPSLIANGIDSALPCLTWTDLRTPLGLSLKSMLEPLHMSCIIHRDCLWFVPNGLQDFWFAETAVYRTDIPHTAAAAKELIELVESVAPLTWASVGACGTCKVGKGVLLVYQQADTQREIERRLGSHLQRVEPGPITFPASGKARRALAKPISLHLNGEPVEKVLQAIDQRLGVPILIKESALRGASIGMDTPCILELDRQPMGKALDILLRGLHMSYLIEGDVIVATTVDDVAISMSAIEYDARALNAIFSDRKEALDCLYHVIQPITWAEVGAPGSARFLPDHNALSITQSYTAHADLHRLFALLEAAGATPAAAKVAPKKK